VESWIYDCSKEDACTNEPGWISSDSSSFATTETSFGADSLIITYTSVYESTDVFCPTSDSSSCTDNQFKFGVNDYKSSDSNSSYSLDGVVGLSSGNSADADTDFILINKLLTDNVITEEKFSYYFSDAQNSYIDFGTPNTSVYTEAVAYVPIDSEQNYWAATFEGLSING